MRRLLDRAVAASSNGIVITDPKLPDNPIVYVNPAFEKISGYATDEVLGRNCRFLQADDRDQQALEELRVAIREVRECRVVLRNYRKDGTPFWNELYVSPVHDEDGRLTNFVGVLNDVTHRRRIEEERDALLVKEQRARAEAVEVRRRLALLAAAGPSLSASLDYEETLEGITRLLVPELADWCLLDIVEDDGSVNQLAAAHAEEEKEDLPRRLRKHRRFGEGDPGSTAEVLSTGRSVLIPDLPDVTFYERELEGEHLEIVKRLEPRSLMCVPLLARGKTRGAITLVSSELDRRYDEEDLMLAENLAYRCALAADNARLYRDRSEIARVLQRSLLPPHLPEIPGVEVGAEYLPVGEANDVGGDFYDLINTVEDGWLCAIGDVRGKGVEAASVTALARYTIRAVTLKDDRPSRSSPRSTRLCSASSPKTASARQLASGSSPRTALRASGSMSHAPAIRRRSWSAPAAMWRKSAVRAGCSACSPTPSFWILRCVSCPARRSSSTRTASPRRALLMGTSSVKAGCAISSAPAPAVTRRLSPGGSRTQS